MTSSTEEAVVVGMRWRWVAVVIAVCLTSACNKNKDDSDADNSQDGIFDATPEGGVLRFINAIPDSPVLSFTYEASWDGSGGTASLAFGAGTQLAPIASGYDIVVSYANSDGETVRLFEFTQELGDTDIELEVDEDKTLVVEGLLMDPMYTIIDTLEYRYGLDEPADDETLTVDPDVVFIHAVYGEGALDFYLTQTSVALTTVAPTVSLAFSDYSPPVSLEPRDDYRLRVTPVGDPGTVLFDSGTFPVSVNVRSVYPATNYFGPGGAKVQVKPMGVSFTDEDLPNAVRFVNLVADVPEMDLYFGDTADEPLVPGLRFQEMTSYFEQEAQDVSVNVTPSGVDNRFVYQGKHSLNAGEKQTLYVTGLLDSPEDEDGRAVAGTLATDDVRPIGSEVSVRAVQGAAGVELLDIYILGPGQLIDDVSPTFSGLTLGGTDVASFYPGDYDIVLLNASNRTEVFGPERIHLDAGSLYSLVVSESAGGGGPLDVRLLDFPIL